MIPQQLVPSISFQRDGKLPGLSAHVPSLNCTTKWIQITYCARKGACYRENITPSVVGVVNNNSAVVIIYGNNISLEILDIMVFRAIIFKSDNTGFVVEIIQSIRSVIYAFRNAFGD